MTTMNVYNFLEQLNCFFPSNESSEMFSLRVKKYAELQAQMENEAGKQFNYEKMLDLTIRNYPYRSFPNFTEITKNIVYSDTKPENPNAEWEYKNYIVTTEGGYEYEFVSVPPDWEGVHTLSDFHSYREV